MAKFDEIIKHLSNEITAKSQSTMNFRTRIAFVAMAGPFIVLGSIIVATKGSFHVPISDPMIQGCIAIISACYIALSFIAARIEKQSWEMCDKYRATIFRIAKDDSMLNINENDFKDTISVVLTYIITWTLILISAAAITIMAVRIEPKEVNSKSDMNNNVHETQASN